MFSINPNRLDRKFLFDKGAQSLNNISVTTGTSGPTAYMRTMGESIGGSVDAVSRMVVFNRSTVAESITTPTDIGGTPSTGTPTVVQAAVTNAASGTSVAVTVTQTAGNANVVFVGCQLGINVDDHLASLSDTNGNSYVLIGCERENALEMFAFFVPNIVGGSNTITATFNRSVTTPEIYVVELNNALAVDAASFKSGGSGTTTDSGSITTTGPNELLLAYELSQGATPTAAGGFSALTGSPTAVDGMASQKNAATAGSYSASCTLGGSLAWEQCIIAISSGTTSALAQQIGEIAQVSAANATNPAVVNTPTGAQSGDLLLFFMGWTSQAGATISAPAGASLIARVDHPATGGLSITLAAYMIQLSAAPAASYSWSASPSSSFGEGVVCIALRGADPTNPIDIGAGAPTTNDGHSTAPSATALSTTYVNEFLLMFFMTDTTNVQNVWSQDFAALVNDLDTNYGSAMATFGNGWGVYARPVSALGSIGTSNTLPSAFDWATLMLAVVPQQISSGGGVIRVLGHTRSISESVATPSDVVTPVVVHSGGTAYTRAVPESISTPSDVVVRQAVLARTVLESVATPSDVGGVPSTGTPTVVQAAFTDASSPNTTVAVTVTQTLGNANVVFVAHELAFTADDLLTGLSDTNGNSYKFIGASREHTMAIYAFFAKNIASGSNTITATFNNSVVWPEIYVVEVNNSYDVDAASFNSGPSGTTTDSGPIVTTGANELLLAYQSNQGATPTAAGGFTALSGSPTSYAGMATSMNATTAGSYSASCTLGGSLSWAQCVVALSSGSTQPWVNQVGELAQQSASTATTPAVVSPPTGATTGDVLFFFFAQCDQAGSTITAPAGTSLVVRVDRTGTLGLDLTEAVYMLVLTGPPAASYTFNATPASAFGMGVICIALRGVDTSNPIDSGAGAPTTSNGASSTPSATALTATNASEYALMFFLTGQPVNGSWGQGFAALCTDFDGSGKNFATFGTTHGVYARSLTRSGSTGTPSNTLASADDWVTAMFAVNASPAASGGVITVVGSTRSISESVATPSDAVTPVVVHGGTAFTRTLSESIINPSDAITRAWQGARALTESAATPSDVLTRQTVLARTLSESIVGPSDALSRSWVGLRPISESVAAPSDGSSRQLTTSRFVTESITNPSDGISRAYVGHRSIAESLTNPSDAISRQYGAIRALTESLVNPSDGVSRKSVLARQVLDSLVSPSDVVGRQSATTRLIAEAIPNYSDAVSRQTVLARAVSEALSSPTDSVLTGKGFARAISETVTLPSDTVARIFAASRGISEVAPTPTDSVAVTVALHGHISEAVATPTDAIARQLTNVRQLAETVSLPVDSTSRLFVGFRITSESIATPADSVSRLGTLTRTLTESITNPSDAVSRAFSVHSSLTESIAIPTDAIAERSGFLRSTTESVATPSDAISRTYAATRSVFESTILSSDSVVSFVAARRSLLESVATASDVVVRTLVNARTLFESTVTPLDSVTSQIGHAGVHISESISDPFDSVSRGTVLLRSISETIAGPNDAVLRNTTTTKTVLESIVTPLDSAARVYLGVRTTTESVSVPSDVVIRQTSAHRSLSETLSSPSDQISRALVLLRPVTESISGPTDSVAYLILKLANVAESVATPNDSVTRLVVQLRGVSESIGSPSDLIHRALTLFRVLTENGASGPSDSVTKQTLTTVGISEAVTTADDSVARSAAYHRVTTESVPSPTDQAHRIFGAFGAITETLVVPIDNVARRFVGLRFLGEGIGTPTDSVIGNFGFRIAMSEAVGTPSDSVSVITMAKVQGVYLRLAGTTLPVFQVGGPAGAKVNTGTGDPNNSITGSPGDLYLDQQGGLLWVKESGVGTSTGWVSK